MYSVASVKATTNSQPSFIMFRQHYVSEAEELSGSLVCSVLCLRVEEAVCAPPAPQCLQPAGSSILTLADRGHGSHWSEHQLCLFSPAALRDRCKCSSNLDTLGEISPAALYLFNAPRSPSPSPPPLPSHPPSRTGFIIPACSFFTPALRSFRDVNKSDSGDRWNDRISLSAGSLVTLPSPLWLLLPPLPHLLSLLVQLLPHSPGPRLNSVSVE